MPEGHREAEEPGSPIPAAEPGLYVHLPFCRVRCTYCAFAISTDQRLESRYMEALARELRLRAADGRRFGTVYLGGGTPSRLSEQGVERLARSLAELDISTAAERTLEANPEDVDPRRLHWWTAELGINRISLGVQSFHDEELRPLGRQHGGKGATRAVEMIAGHVERLSIDLMLGLPHQTLASVASNVRDATRAGVGHISLYILDLEEGSALERQVRTGAARLPADDTTAGMYREVVLRAEQAGLVQYEVSNFARPGQEAVHNRRYWQRVPYVGVGLGAHSFDGARRSANTRSIDEYVEMLEAGKLPETFEETLSPEEVRHERLLLGMRQAAGLEIDEVRELAGEAVIPWLEEGVQAGWLAIQEQRVSFTVEGFLLSDGLISRLF